MIRALNPSNKSIVASLPLNSNGMNYSVFRELQAPIRFRSFSIKYVISGEEKYRINGVDYDVKTGEYVLANTHAEGSVLIDSKSQVKGLCIDISQDLLSEITAAHIRPDSAIPDKSLDRFFHTEDFLEQKFLSNSSYLGTKLQLLGAHFENHACIPEELPVEHYYEMAELLLADYIPLHRQLQTVKAVKASTRKALFRAVEKGKAFIDEHFSSPISVAEIAREATLSEYHFHRLFKNMYGLSPYHYLMKRRLEFSQTLLQKHLMSVSEAALNTGFSDIHSFSKAFKKHFGVSPSGFAVMK